jgi:hypothetical protein
VIAHTPPPEPTAICTTDPVSAGIEKTLLKNSADDDVLGVENVSWAIPT